MWTLEDFQNLKTMGVTGFKEFYEPMMDINETVSEDYKLIEVPYNEGINTYYNEGDVVVNIPSDSNIEFNITPDLTTGGDLTASIKEDEDTVKSDPFDISPIADPEDPQAYLNSELEEQESVEEEDTTPRFMTLQDLM